MPGILRPLALRALALWLGFTPWAFASPKDQPAPNPPEVRILVGPLGYRPPGPLYMLSRKSFSTLDFVDEHHLLFTFRQPRLLRREPKPNRSENGQNIQAVLLDLPGGTVQASAEWRLHDRSRYLWALGEGKFLLRQKNQYSFTDASLQLRAYIAVTTPVMATEISPDGRVLVIEHQYERHTTEQHSKLEAQAAQYGEPPPDEDTQITLIDTATRESLGALRTELPISVPVTDGGYVGLTKGEGQDQYVARYIPFKGEASLLGTVASTCTPRENFLNPTEVLIESCGPKSSDTYLDAWTIAGKKLWSSRRDGHLVWPTFAYARAGNRFAVALLRVSHPIDLVDSLNDEDVREQVVQVFDAATGGLLFATNAMPVLTAGQNFALSEDGQHLAVLRQGAIEIYKLPAAAPTTPPKK